MSNYYKIKYIDLKYGGSRNETYKLNIPKTWRFDTPFPDDIKNDVTASKLWFIKKTIRYKTSKNHQGKQFTAKIPEGLTILKNNKLENIEKNIEELFKNHKKYDIPHDHQKYRGLEYLFTYPSKGYDTGKKQTISSRETISKLHVIDDKFAKYVESIIDRVADNYNMDVELFLDNSQVVLLKYDDEFGIWLHIDNIARYDQGPIITVSIGPKKIYYDFAPSIVSDADIKKNNYEPFRIRIHNNDIVIMDGPARMEWSHGLPYNMKYETTKYSVLIKCDKFLEKVIKHNDVLGIDVIQSGLKN